MIGVRVEGAEKLATVAGVLRQMGDKELRRELIRGLNRAVKPLKAAAKESAATTLPQRGGLARRVARSRLSTRRRLGRDVSIRIEAKGMPQLRLMDEGTVRHPVFGRRDVFVSQPVRPGWFTDPLEAGRDDVVREIDAALDDVARQVAAKISAL